MKAWPQIAACGLIGAYLAGASVGHALGHMLSGAGAPSSGAAQAVSYAEAQVGKPYCWAGNGPSCYDCSGLMQQAWASAGVSIPRTTFAEWAQLPHVSRRHLKPGTLVLAPGADGTQANPGHVGMYVGHGKVVQAYMTGYPISVTSLSNFAAGAGGIVGYARP